MNNDNIKQSSIVINLFKDKKGTISCKIDGFGCETDEDLTDYTKTLSYAIQNLIELYSDIDYDKIISINKDKIDINNEILEKTFSDFIANKLGQLSCLN